MTPLEKAKWILKPDTELVNPLNVDIYEMAQEIILLNQKVDIFNKILSELRDQNQKFANFNEQLSEENKILKEGMLMWQNAAMEQGIALKEAEKIMNMFADVNQDHVENEYILTEEWIAKFGGKV